MKKKLSLVIGALLLFVFSSCEKKQATDLIIGTWEAYSYHKISFRRNGEVMDEYLYKFKNDEATLTFHENGTMDNCENHHVVRVTYIKTGDMLTIMDSEGTGTMYTIQKLTSSELELFISIIGDNDEKYESTLCLHKR